MRRREGGSPPRQLLRKAESLAYWLVGAPLVASLPGKPRIPCRLLEG